MQLEKVRNGYCFAKKELAELAEVCPTMVDCVFCTTTNNWAVMCVTNVTTVCPVDKFYCFSRAGVGLKVLN